MQPSRRELVSGALERNDRGAEGRPEQSSDSASERVAGQPDLSMREHHCHVVVQIGANQDARNTGQLLIRGYESTPDLTRWDSRPIPLSVPSRHRSDRTSESPHTVEG